MNAQDVKHGTKVPRKIPRLIGTLLKPSMLASSSGLTVRDDSSGCYARLQISSVTLNSAEDPVNDDRRRELSFDFLILRNFHLKSNDIVFRRRNKRDMLTRWLRSRK